MFLNANTGAKASQEMAARFVAAKAAKARAKAIANGEVVEVLPSKKPTGNKSLKQLGENGTESTWLSERHEKLRTDAIHNIQKAITKTEELKGAVSTTLERLVEVAYARLLCSNERGAILSMKKVVACQGQQEYNSDALDALEKLFLDIGSGDVKPEGHEAAIKKILAVPMKKKTMNDDEMLKELDKLAQKKHSSVHLDDQKLFD